ncbi:MAG: hypothetical protein ACE5FS_11730, partial [Paracoccaceae bacterium]
MTKEIYPRSLDDLGELSPAEQKVLEGACAGQPVVLGDGERPDGPSEERTIRAGLIRLLLQGGCDGHQTHEKGVEVLGAYVDGVLDLEGCVGLGPLMPANCRFSDAIIARNAEMRALILNGSAVPARYAPGAKITGDV